MKEFVIKAATFAKTILIVVFLFVGMESANAAEQFSSETLKYVISYKWGLIHKDAGEATLASRRVGDLYKFTLTARTKPWADRVFKVRDTLDATVSTKGFQPVSYVKSAHEGGRFSRDVISFSWSGAKVSGKCDRLREKKGNVSKSSISLSATGPTFDMLSVFYWLRTLDFSGMPKEKVTRVTIFSGSKSETLSIRLVGQEEVKLKDGTHSKAWHIKFNFTTAGKKKSSDDIDCWLSADGRKIPLLLVGTLPVGQVRCYYVGKV